MWISDMLFQVNTACQSGMMLSVIDRSMGPYPSDCIKKLMALALRCSMDETKDRPSMLEVVRELENISSMVPESDNTASGLNLNMSSSGNSVASPPSSSLYDERRTYVSMDLLPGSDLVSGVIPTINPRWWWPAQISLIRLLYHMPQLKNSHAPCFKWSAISDV